MSKLYTEKDIKQMLDQGQCLSSLPADAKFSPMARDLLRQQKIRPSTKPVAASPSESSKNLKRLLVPVSMIPSCLILNTIGLLGGDPKTAKDLEKFFYSPEIESLKQCICEIGKRIWNKGYVDGNGGNITVRVGDNLVLCTPTLISKVL